MAQGLEGLEVWQKSMEFAKRIYGDVLPRLPKEEKWAMANQLRRAAQSIPANIAEGYGRYYFQEGVRFCYIARGSLEECYTFLKLASDLDYLDRQAASSLVRDIETLRKLINGYMSFLKRKKRGENEPGARYSAREIGSEYEIDIDPEDLPTN